MSSAGPPRPPGMPAYPQPPGGAKLPPMPPGIKAAGAPPTAPAFHRPPAPPAGPPLPPGGAPRYPQPPSGVPMPPGMAPRPPRSAMPAHPRRAETMDPSAYDPTQNGGGGAAPVSRAYLAPPSAHAYPAPPGATGGEIPYMGGGGGAEHMYGGGYGDEGPYGADGGARNYNDRRRGRGSRYGGVREDEGGRRGGRHRDDRYRDDGNNYNNYNNDGNYNSGGRHGRQGRPRTLIEAPPPRDPTNTVWIGNVDPTVHSDQRLIETFKEFGMVMQLAKHEDKGYCFVHYRTIEEARSAIDALTQRGTLAPAVYSYGKMCEYRPEEMTLPFDPNFVPVINDNSSRAAPGGPSGMSGGDMGPSAPGMRRGRDRQDDFGEEYSAAGSDNHGGTQPPERRRARGEREPLPPTSVLWVGSLPPFVTANSLREIFSPFGTITRVTRMDKSNIAFVHFETIEQCTLALQTMSGRPIEGGAVLALNYGHQPRNPESSAEGGATSHGPGGPLELTPDGYPVNEARTNAVYLGLIPADATEEEVTKLYDQFEGYINCRYVPTNAIAFGHYDTVEHALAARIALHGQLLHGTPLRVMFGKNNHSYTLADRDGAPGTAEGPDGTLIVSGAGGGASSGVLAALPARGGGGGVADAVGATAAQSKSVYTRVRAAPVETIESRLHTLLGVPYNQCGASGAELSPGQIDDLCHMADYCVDEKTAVDLDHTLSLYLPIKATHAFNVVAKRMLEYFKDDPHKRLLALYATTRAMLGAPTNESEVHVFNEASLNAYLMVLAVATENQTPSGLDRLTSILESLRHHSFLQKKSLVSQAYADDFGKHLDNMMERVKAEQDLASLLSAVKGH